ncbi:MAG: MFS transporter [Chloroflexi bacterium]|nr:MFS transporter [Chloroflexota bacterium]
MAAHKRPPMLLPVYIPTLLLSFAQGLTIYTLPLYAKELGGNLAIAGIAVAASGIGTTLTDLPAGLVLARFGQRRLMLVGAGATGLVALLIALIHAIGPLIGLRIIMGIGTSLWSLSRMAYVTGVTRPAERGRILSTFGGVNRIGLLAGPVTGGLIAGHFGLASPFFITSICSLAAAVLAATTLSAEADAHTVRSRQLVRWNVLALVLREHWFRLVTAGSAQVFAQMIRNGRQFILPIYGSSALGLSVEVISLIGSVGAALDVVMFVPAGFLMDRLGRKFASVPSFFLLAIGMGLIPLAHNAFTFLLVAVFLGAGNGIGAGTMLTLGADLAPPSAVGEFLGMWRLIGDGGTSIGPMLVGVLSAVFGLTAAALTLSGIGLLAALTLVLFVPETLVGHQPSTRST